MAVMDIYASWCREIPLEDDTLLIRRAFVFGLTLVPRFNYAALK